VIIGFFSEFYIFFEFFFRINIFQNRNFSLEIPEGYKLAEVPKSVQLNSEFGSYSLQFSMENGKLVTQRKITILKNIYPKEKFKEYIEFRKKTNNLDNTKILLTKI
jgi:hypothetical protein